MSLIALRSAISLAGSLCRSWTCKATLQLGQQTRKKDQTHLRIWSGNSSGLENELVRAQKEASVESMCS